MRKYVDVVVTKASSDKWYNVGQKLKVAYSPSKEAYVTSDDRVVEAMDIRSK